MNVLLVSTCKEKLHEREFVLPFVRYLESKGINVAVAHYSTIMEKEIDGAERIILCGTGLADNDYLEHKEKLSWLKDIDVPVLGICSGIQSIVLAFGGEIISEKEIGPVKVSGNLFGRKEFNAYALHQNGISLPENFEILARSEKSIQAIKHTKKKVFGVTFHPEVRNLWVIDGFLNS